MNRVELHQVALDRLVSLTTLQPDNEKAFFNLGMITMDEVCYGGIHEKGSGDVVSAVCVQRDR